MGNRAALMIRSCQLLYLTCSLLLCTALCASAASLPDDSISAPPAAAALDTNALPPLSVQAVHDAASNRVVQLGLKDYLHMVLQHNESIQAQMLDAEVYRRKARGERGIFEPQLETSVNREANKRTNNIEQQAAQGGDALFEERNTIYDGGLEALVPTGGKIRLGATMSDLANNINPAGIFGGGSLTNMTRQYKTSSASPTPSRCSRGAGSPPRSPPSASRPSIPTSPSSNTAAS